MKKIIIILHVNCAIGVEIVNEKQLDKYLAKQKKKFIKELSEGVKADMKTGYVSVVVLPTFACETSIAITEYNI